jgi:hypothetical protein
MSMIENTQWCYGCGTEIDGNGVVIERKLYCCIDCWMGVGCTCYERMELGDDYPSKYALLESGYSVPA